MKKTSKLKLMLPLISLALLLSSGFANSKTKKNLTFLYDSTQSINESQKVKYSLYLSESGSSESSNREVFTITQNTYDESALAFCTYEESLLEKGWDFLALSSYQGSDLKYSDDQKAFGMGYLEGYITAEKIWYNYQNQKKYTYGKNKNSKNGEMPQSVRLFLNKNFQYIRIKGRKNYEKDPYWQHAYLIFRQLEGLLDGYNARVASGDLAPIEAQKLTLADLHVINAAGDIGDIEYFKNESARPQFEKMTHSQIAEHFEARNHCSALIKVAADFSDVWFGHNTWTNFSSMLRIFKEYRFATNNNSEKSKTVAFSSYPGSLSSIDDFYVTDRDLYVTETTNQVFENSLFNQLTPHSLLSWHRAIIANRLSDSGQEWTQIFAKNNSGTYNNQFQILDLKKIDTERKVIEDGALWIIEQIPGDTESADVTRLLRYGYWPSYNSAYFPRIRKLSGYDAQLEKHPELKDSIDYSTCARANIFRRDQNKIESLEDYKKLLRYNDFENDALSKQNPGFAIACRRDLDPKKPDCRGATDAKIASIHNIKGKKNKKITMISGPTSDQQPAFDWSNAVCMQTGKYVFNGLPQKFDFPWVEYETQLMD